MSTDFITHIFLLVFSSRIADVRERGTNVIMEITLLTIKLVLECGSEKAKEIAVGETDAFNKEPTRARGGLVGREVRIMQSVGI